MMEYEEKGCECPVETIQKSQKYTAFTDLFRFFVKKKLAMLQFYWYYISR